MQGTTNCSVPWVLTVSACVNGKVLVIEVQIGVVGDTIPYNLDILKKVQEGSREIQVICKMQALLLLLDFLLLYLSVAWFLFGLNC